MAYGEIIFKTESARCLLCGRPACSEACENGLDIAGIIRSVRFENITGAKRRIGETNACAGCTAPCMNKCNRAKIDKPVDITGIVEELSKIEVEIPKESVDLSIDFLGVKCENPFFLSSSVVGSNYEMLAKAFDMGWAGVSFKTIGLFVPNEASPRFATLEKEDNPFVGFKNIEQISDHTTEENLDFIRRLKADYPKKVIIASIMGRDEEEWMKLASLVEKAGADIIECNFSCPQMTGKGVGSDVGVDPELVGKYTAATRRGTSLPILAKMTPNITRIEDPAKAAVLMGADGLSAINTIKSIVNVDIHSFTTQPTVSGKSTVGGYSGKAVKPIALRVIHDIKKTAELADVPISGMGGIETWRDSVEFISMGCETLQITTAVMQYGYRIIDDLKEGLSDYMVKEGFKSVSEIEGRALPDIVPAADIDRDTVEYPKFVREKCVGCGRCYISCFDGGHQALEMTETGPKLTAEKCVGCQLCRVVCPAGAIASGSRVAKNLRH